MPSVPRQRPARSRTTESALTLPSLGRSLRLLGRALRLQCPHCGRGAVLAPWRFGRAWGGMHERCGACGFHYERSDDGYFGGAMLVNLLTAELLFFVGFIAAILLTWPSVPWDALTYWGAAGMLLLPVLWYPVAKVLWLAVDVLVRPVSREELG